MQKRRTIHSIQQHVTFLRAATIFSDIDEEKLVHIATALEEYVFEPDEEIFHKGDDSHSMYIVETGRVKVHDDDLVFTELTSGQAFGEYSLIEASKRSATVTAVEKSHLLRLDKEVFYEVMSQNMEIMQSILKTLVTRMRDKDRLETELAYQNNEILQQNEEIEAQRNEIQAQRDEIEKQRDRLEHLNQTKDKFFSILSHDLRNPFNSLLNITNLLKQNFQNYTEKQLKHFIDNINKSIKETYNLLENILHWSRSQTNSITISPENIDIMEIAKHNISLLENAAKHKNISIRFHTANAEDRYVLADANTINTVVRNLISNAIKFTKRNGEIDIYSKKSKDNVLFSVKDNGIGIEKKHLKRLFRIDVSHSTKGTANESGTGLGLILCKEFVEKNNGKIRIKSKLNEGSTFTITLPVASEIDENTKRDTQYERQSLISDKNLEFSIEIKPEQRKHIPDLLNELKKTPTEQRNTVKATNRIRDIKKFGDTILTLGKKYSVDLLINYGKNINLQADNFDINGLQSSIELFDEILHELEHIVSDS